MPMEAWGLIVGAAVLVIVFKLHKIEAQLEKITDRLGLMVSELKQIREARK